MGKLHERLAKEPKAARGLPTCPSYLRGRAKYAWKFWAAELQAMGLDRRPDAMMLEGACQNYGRAVEAEAKIRAEGLTVEECTLQEIEDPETGEKSTERVVLKVKNHPAVAIANQAWRLVRAFCSEFGLSPVSRTRLTIEKKDDSEADLLALLSKPRDPRKAPTVN